jgi:pimeloyl-ACP methyl ester carboxylesterase
VPARCLAERARAALKVDVREMWKEVTPPALSISFHADSVVPGHNAEEIAQLRPSTESIRLPGDHLTVSKNHGPWSGEVVRFIRRTIARHE